MEDPFKARTLKRKNVKGLALSAPAPKAANPPEGDSQVPGSFANTQSNHTDTLEIGLEFQLDLKSEDLIVMKELGFGNGGTVSKVMHATTKVIMARKIIRVDAKENVRKQIIRELQVGRDCSSPYVITFYGAFQNEARDVVLCMEYMDCGSLDRVSRDFGPVRVDVLGKITEAMLGGLVYLYETHRIMHRDIKPSNVLLNSRGMIKLCDFGVATETVNSVANTFVGTSTYMAPERIKGGASYTIKSDVWSVGLTIMELAIGRFPFNAGDSAAGDRASVGPMGILDLLQQIVHEPAPKLPKSDAFPAILDEFCAKCLLKDADKRPTPRELFDRDNFVQAAKRTPVDLQGWAISMMDRHNRKSYLAPPAPKSLKSDGTSADISSYNNSGPPTGSTMVSSNHSTVPTPVTARRHPSSNSHEVPMPMPSNQPAARFQTQYANGMPSQIPIGIAERSPPIISLQHLSLETSDEPESNSRSNRLGYNSRDNQPEPASAIEGYSRPSYGSRTTSGNSMPYGNRMPLQQATLPARTPPPSGPLPNPPIKELPPPPPFGRIGAVASPRRQR